MEEVLFTSQEVAGCTVQPWTLGQLSKLMPAFERLAVGFKRRGIALKDVLRTVQSEPFSVLVPLAEELGEILTVTVGKPREEIDRLRIDQVIELSLVVIRQNVEYLKNSFGPASEAISNLTTE
jgi:hypothetical protein